ncbi:hypothetical protein ABPG75_000591 [Micractinium tetrahymenae]
MAPKPKKKKEGAEARKAREQMEALAAAEGEAARRAAAGAAMRERAAREAQATAVNSRKLNAEWLQRMRAAKLEELHAEAGALSREHDAQVDRYDRMIEALLEDLEAQDTQHDVAAAAHAEVLDQLLGLHRERLGAAHSRFQGDLRALQDEYESEKSDMVALHNRHKKELADISAALAAAYAETRAEAAASYRLMEEELRNRSSEALNVMKLGLEGRVRELEGAVEAQHKEYLEAMGPQDAAYRELAQADAAAGEAIEQRTARLRQLQATLAQWRGRVVTNSNEWQRRNSALAREKEVVLGHHTALKAALAAFRRAQEARLKQMCVSYAAVESGLKQHLATAQRIIRVAQLARKHELPGEAAAAAAAAEAADGDQQAQPAADTEAEAADEQAAKGQAAAGSQGGEQAQGGNPGNSDSSGSAAGSVDELGLAQGSTGQRLLEAFVQRMGGAALDGAALGQERLRLAAENATLKAVVAAVRGGTTLGPGTVQDPLNTLLVVNGRLQKELGGAALARRAMAGPSTVSGRTGSSRA